MSIDLSHATLSDFIAGISTLVALLALALSFFARRSAGRSAERATTATEKMANIQARIFEGPAWSLRNLEASLYIVTNESSIAAENVSIVPDPVVDRFEWQETSGVTIEPHSATKFRITFGLNDSTGSIRSDIVVTWTRPEDPTVRTWRHPLPPRS